MILIILFQVGLAVVNGQLYAVGGFDGTAYLKTIEVYDPDQNQWRLCGAMNYRRLGGGVGVMRAPQTENYFWWDILKVDASLSRISLTKFYEKGAAISYRKMVLIQTVKNYVYLLCMTSVSKILS